jgi:hypothetical protein
MISPINSIALLIVSVLFSCSRGTTNSHETVDSNLMADSVSGKRHSGLKKIAQDSLVLYERGINNLTLPLERREVLPDLRNAFVGLTVTKEIRQRDGPDFLLYSINDEIGEICFFAMDSEDTLKLREVHIKTPLVKDQYGLRVGDGYQKIAA